MRKHNAHAMTVGDITLHLVPEEKSRETIKREKSDPNHVRRSHYEMMYGRPVDDEELKSLP